MKENEEVKQSEFSVDKMRYEVKRLANRFQLVPDALEVNQIEEMIAQQMLMEIRYKIYGCDIKEIKYPANWKEALKERFLPKFLKKKFVVKYTTFVVSHLLPKEAIRNNEKPVIVTWQRS